MTAVMSSFDTSTTAYKLIGKLASCGSRTMPLLTEAGRSDGSTTMSILRT